MVEENEDFQKVLQQNRKLHAMQKQQTENERKKNEELEKEIDFWLPGYRFFESDASLRNTLSKLKPNRIPSEI